MSATLESGAAYEATVLGFLQRQFTTPKPLRASTSQLDGQTAIVSGSNGGLGLEACRQLLERRLSHLVMAVRSQAKGEAAAKQLRQQFPDPGVSISVWALDMASYDSIRQFVEQCATLSRIDIVILNAAGVHKTYMCNPTTGHESTMQTNYLSTVLLGILLLPVLRSTRERNNDAPRPPVLSFVESDLAYSAQNTPNTTTHQGPVLAQYDDEKSFGLMSSYAASKLLLVLFVSRLAELVDPADVLINTCNPGFTRYSDLDSHAFPGLRMFMKLSRTIVGRSVEAAASVYLDATLARGAESHGSFISDWEIKP